MTSLYDLDKIDYCQIKTLKTENIDYGIDLPYPKEDIQLSTYL